MGGAAGGQGGVRMSASTTKLENADPKGKGQQNPNITHIIQTSWRTLRYVDEDDHVVAFYALSLEGWSDSFEINCYVAWEESGKVYFGDICGSGVFVIDGDLMITDIIRVEETHRRRGISTTICDIAFEHAGAPWGKPTLLPDGVMFWSAYLGQPSTSFNCVGS
jgi:hypothetical protein